MSEAKRPFRKQTTIVFPIQKRWLNWVLLTGVLALITLMLWGMPQPVKGETERLITTDGSRSNQMVMNAAVPDWQATVRVGDGIHFIAGDLSDPASFYANLPLSFTAAYTAYLPIVFKPVPNLKSLVTNIIVALPQPLSGTSGNWCTWGYCTLSPRLYHEPLNDGRTLVGWTDASGDGHISVIGNGGNLEQTYDFPSLSVRGLTAHTDGTFAILLWDANAKIMWLSKWEPNGSEIWAANIDGDLTSFNSGIGDSRLAYGNNLYAAYFAVHGDTGWPAGHEGDQLIYVNDAGVIQSGGWDWGCSHSMSELINYHPTLDEFIPVCSSDCYASKGILLNDSQVVYPSDGNCGGLTSAQLGQITFDDTSWKLVFNALNRPGYVGKGIGLATIDGSFQSSYVWLTNTNGDYERDPVMARLGSSLQTDRYVIGWTTTNDGVYWLGVIDGNGDFIMGPEELSSAGIAWGNRDDSFRTRTDGTVSWVQGDPASATLHLFHFDGATYIP
ncbi:MAG: hypothetical protein GY803_06000 [Chloroflexi bacterium]|nr:hypothetical protein [Chloroflexota bacterium]